MAVTNMARARADKIRKEIRGMLESDSVLDREKWFKRIQDLEEAERFALETERQLCRSKSRHTSR